MRKLFRWTSLKDFGVLGWLLEVENRLDELRENLNVSASLCLLTLFTLVADVERLTPRSGFVAQKDEILTEHRICAIWPAGSKKGIYANALLDSHVYSFDEYGPEKPGKYKLMLIGRGKKLERSRHMRGEYERDDYSAPPPIDWVALLVEQREDHYERIGLTTGPVQKDPFVWKLQRIDIA